MTDELRRRVLELYEAVDREVAAAGPLCIASGRCCRFKEYGHALFLSNLEADVLLAAAPPYQQPVTPEYCPFQKDNLCTAREPRPLGCRVYYCDPSYQEAGNRITGPAIVQVPDTTIVVHPGQAARLDPYGNVLIELHGEA